VETNAPLRAPINSSRTKSILKNLCEILRFDIDFTKALHWNRNWTKRFHRYVEMNVRLSRSSQFSSKEEHLCAFGMRLDGHQSLSKCGGEQNKSCHHRKSKLHLVHLITSRCIHVIWWQAVYISNRRRRIDAALSVYSCGTGRISLGLPAFPRESSVACSVSTDKCPVIGSNLKWWKTPSGKFVWLRHLWLFLVSDQPGSLNNDWTPSVFWRS